MHHLMDRAWLVEQAALKIFVDFLANSGLISGCCFEKKSSKNVPRSRVLFPSLNVVVLTEVSHGPSTVP